MGKASEAMGKEIAASVAYLSAGSAFLAAGRPGHAEWAFSEAANEMRHAQEVARFAGEVDQTIDDAGVLAAVEVMAKMESDLYDFYAGAASESTDASETEFMLRMLRDQRKARIDAASMLRRAQTDLAALDLHMEASI